MSLHIEWDQVTGIELAALTPDEVAEHSEDTTIPTQHGLLIGGAGGGALMVEGSPDALIAFARRVLEAAESLRA